MLTAEIAGKRRRRIGILEAGRPTVPDLLAKHGSYAEMSIHMLMRCDPRLSVECEFPVYSVLENHFPSSERECDAWLVTGSPNGVYEELPWMLRLQEFLRVCFQQRIPMVGICFGHQILGQALGGHVERAKQGMGLGIAQYRLSLPTPPPEWAVPLPSPSPDTLNLLVMHNDQVVTIPPNAHVLFSNDHCPHAALLFDSVALGIQSHPEFSLAYETDCIDYWAQDPASGIHPAVFASAAESIRAMQGHLHSDVIGQWISQFIQFAWNRR